ncbi:hypothetical protein ACFWOG_04425 [Kitasatospora sp. NPDC058406]|uniref:hypothetical protein n=1 Tax=Kitasatospora sp. NPDC058406 TaxID=3346483 RepID=UPI00366A2236
MASQVTQGVIVGGLTLAAGGFALGFFPVGDDCGSPWSPKESSYSRDVSAECTLKISERQAPAWMLLTAGAAGLFGGLAARPKLEATVPANPVEEEPKRRGVGEGPLVP